MLKAGGGTQTLTLFHLSSRFAYIVPGMVGNSGIESQTVRHGYCF
jgi:hypothetical protein